MRRLHRRLALRDKSSGEAMAMQRLTMSRRWLLPAVAVGLVASLALNVLLAREVRDSFVALQLARVFPLGYTLEPPRPDIAGTPESVVFYGDSRASAWSEVGLTGGRRSENRAHGAQTASQTLLQLQTAPAVRSGVAIVQVGINDLHPLGAMPAHKDEILRRLRATIPQIRDRLLERSDLVVLTTLFPPGPVPCPTAPTFTASSTGASCAGPLANAPPAN